METPACAGRDVRLPRRFLGLQVLHLLGLLEDIQKAHAQGGGVRKPEGLGAQAQGHVCQQRAPPRKYSASNTGPTSISESGTRSLIAIVIIIHFIDRQLLP